MFKIIAAIFLSIGSSCHEPDYCVGCSHDYPYYSSSHLKTTAIPIANLPSMPASGKVQLQKLHKVMVFPVSNKRNTVVGFADEFLKALEERGWKIVDSDTQIHHTDPLIDIKNATGFIKPDIVVSYMTEMSETEQSKYFYKTWSKFPKDHFLKIAILEDFYSPWQIENAAYFSQYADFILTRYPEAFEQLLPDCKKPVFTFPHAAGKEYLQTRVDFNKKEPKMLLSGALNPRWYPLRMAALKLYDSGDKKIVLRRHPGYQPGIDPIKEAKAYAEQIAHYDLALTGAGMGQANAAPYIFAKHFEIAATGTVMVTDKFVAPLLAQLGFIENVNYLATTPDNLKADLETWLAPNNKENLKRIGLAGRKLILERHSLEQRVHEFENMIYYAWRQVNSQKP